MSENENTFDAAAMAQLSAEDLIAQIDALDDGELAAVHEEEATGQARPDVLSAIADERAVRAAGSEPTDEPSNPGTEAAPEPAPQAAQPELVADENGMVPMHAPENSGDVSHGGKTYACQNGIVRVPEEAVATLKMHGFSVASAE